MRWVLVAGVFCGGLAGAEECSTAERCAVLGGYNEQEIDRNDYTHIPCYRAAAYYYARACKLGRKDLCSKARIRELKKEIADVRRGVDEEYQEGYEQTGGETHRRYRLSPEAPEILERLRPLQYMLNTLMNPTIWEAKSCGQVPTGDHLSTKRFLEDAARSGKQADNAANMTTPDPYERLE